MGGITSGIGLATGIDSGNLINQLLAIEARPRLLAEQRVLQLQQQQGAWLAINSALSGLRSSSGAFRTDSLFGKFTASSSNSDVLTASATTSATPGSYSFFVDRLVSTEQHLSRGFSDANSSGIGAETFTFEDTAGGVSTTTRLSELNGGEGVERGTIRITDKSGGSAEIDLSRAVDIDEVLEAINASGAIQVNASLDGDRVVLTDTSGGAGTLVVDDAFGSNTATSLGIAGSAAGGATTITGSDIRTVSGATALSLLNDGIGVQIEQGSTDFSITTSDGAVLNIDLGQKSTTTVDGDGEDVVTITQTSATDLQDVIDIINAAATAAGKDVTAGISGDGKSLVINDNTGGGGNLIIQSSGSRTTARDLGIATGAGGVAATTVTGERLLAGLNSVLTRSLNGGNGLGNGEFTFTDRSGAATTLTLSQNALDGSLSDVIAELNSGLTGAGVDISVSLNDAGNGLSVTDSSGASGNLIIAGEGATNAGLATTGVASNTFNGDSAQKRWIGSATRLSALNGGAGIGTGEISIIDASGTRHTMTVNSEVATVGELLAFFNSRPDIEINARVNDTGDGILIEDTSGGTGSLIIEDVSGSVAENLNIEGTFTDEGSGIFADGTYEQTIEFDPTDSLDDIVSAINSAGVGVVASIVNDGSPGSPFRLSLTSRGSGEGGRVLIDTGALDLGLDRISEGQDAVVFYGAGDPKDAVLITSGTNTLSDVARGLTINLVGASQSRVNVVVDNDRAAITEGIGAFVENFNRVIGQIDAQSRYDIESERGGPLVGDSTAQRIRRELVNAVQRPVSGFDNEFRYLFEIGIRVGSSGDGGSNRIEFDQERFDRAYNENPEAVEALFETFALEAREDIELGPGITTPNDGPDQYKELGVMEQIRLLVDSYTSSIDGVITGRTNNLDTRIELQNNRIETLNEALDRKRLNLTREFANLELVIANLQSQQSSLATIQNIGPLSF